jgi:hypothetical protein
MATETSAATVTRPADVGLKREMGLIGAIWASESSIIGSGWLFASLYATQDAGPSAIYAWIIGGAAVLILAFVHAELGAMFPVAGGTARFPHIAFGGIAGIQFGFFSWLQAVCIAPVECYAVMHYAHYWWPAIYNPTKGVPTGLGLFLTVILLASFTAINFLGIGWRAVPARSSMARTSTDRAASLRSGPRACSTRWSGPASSSPTSASSRPTSWPARSRTRRRTCRARSSARC